MPVVGQQCALLSDSGKLAHVSPFTPDYDPMEIPIVDAAILYQCPFNGMTYILVIRNALYVPGMVHNLIPPFILREAGISVNDIPKIHVESPGEEHHAITFPETNFRIPLHLWGIFSYFTSSKPTMEQLETSEEIYLLTPDRFNPHDLAYAQNEDAMLDWEGNMVQKIHR